MYQKIREKLYPLKMWYKNIFLYPTFTLGDVDYDKYWKDKRGKTIGELSDWQIHRAQIVSRVIPSQEPCSITDIGCGDGSILHFLKKHLLLSKMYGVDVSPFALNKAQEFGVETVEADITQKETLEKIPSADYILMFEILEHIPLSEEFLLAMLNKSKRGVFFSFPNSGFFTYRLRLLFGRFPLQWRLFPGEHVRFWTAADLKWWLDGLGYKDASIFYYKGVSILNKIWPSLFAAGFVVYIKK